MAQTTRAVPAEVCRRRFAVVEEVGETVDGPAPRCGRNILRTFTASTASWDTLMRGKDTPLGEMFESFLLAKEAAGRSKRTLADYATYLRQFDRSVGSPDLGELVPDRVTRYLAERRRSSPTSARIAAAVLKSFASWLAEMGYLATPLGGSVLAMVKRPRVDRQRTPYTDDEVRRMIRSVSAGSHRT